MKLFKTKEVVAKKEDKKEIDSEKNSPETLPEVVLNLPPGLEIPKLKRHGPSCTR